MNWQEIISHNLRGVIHRLDGPAYVFDDLRISINDIDNTIRFEIRVVDRDCQRQFFTFQIDEREILDRQRARTSTEMRLRQEEAWPRSQLSPMDDDALQREMAAIFGIGFGDSGRRNDEANERAMQLLLENLTDEQRNQYKRHGHFDVIGEQTGRLYKIHKGTEMNITVYGKKNWLTGKREKLHGLCFTTTDYLAPGDVMLAQKITLENDEEKALAIGNKFKILPMASNACQSIQ